MNRLESPNSKNALEHPNHNSGLQKSTTKGFWTERRVEIAKNVGKVALVTFVGLSIIVGTLACLMFIPGAPLVGLGLGVLAAITGKIAGAAAIATAILLPTAFVVLPTAAAAGGTLLAAPNQQDFLKSKILKLKNEELNHTKEDNNKLDENDIQNLMYTPIQQKQKKQKNQNDFKLNYYNTNNGNLRDKLTKDKDKSPEEIEQGFKTIGKLAIGNGIEIIMHEINNDINLKDAGKRERVINIIENQDKSITIDSTNEFDVYESATQKYLCTITLKSKCNLTNPKTTYASIIETEFLKLPKGGVPKTGTVSDYRESTKNQKNESFANETQFQSDDNEGIQNITEI